jgi:hypothetical protein
MSVFTGLSSMAGVQSITNTPSIITSNLLIYLDAANPLSYPGSGTVWTSLVSGGRNGTLVNSPTYTTDGGGCIVLDGIDDHISMSTVGVAGSNLSIDYWIKRNANNGYFWVIDNMDQPELRLLFAASGKNSVLQPYLYDNGSYILTTASSTSFDSSLWYNICVTITNGSQKIYINGGTEIIVGTGSYDGAVSGDNAGEHTLGTYNRPGAGYGGYASVSIASYRFYNRVLTDQEVTQNFNALKGRFGL